MTQPVPAHPHSAPRFKTWAEVPDKPTPEQIALPWFLEIYSGKGWLTRAMRKRGWAILPPIDIVVAGEVEEAASVVDPALMAKVNAWLGSGAVKLVHFGTPCTTFSRARRNDGGPPPIRSDDHLNGIPGIRWKDKESVRLGTEFLNIALRLCRLIASAGGHWSIENPLHSMLWLMPQTAQFCLELQAVAIQMDLCAYIQL